MYPPLLERPLTLTDFNSENPGTYALCYKCHSREAILSESQGFRLHKKHVVDAKAACTTCHDSHGVADAPHLINFNRDYVTPGPGGSIRYSSTGLFKGTCTLTCHGTSHNNQGY